MKAAAMEVNATETISVCLIIDFLSCLLSLEKKITLKISLTCIQDSYSRTIQPTSNFADT